MSAPSSQSPEPFADNDEVATLSEAAPIPYAVAHSDPVPPPPPPAEPAQGYSAARVLRAIRRRWYAALSAGAVCAAALAFAATLYVHADYTGRTEVFISASQPVILFDTGGTDLNTYQRRQAALVRSRHVLQAAIARPDAAALPSVRNNPDPVGGLERDLKTDFSVSPEILRITLSGPEPKELTVLLDAVREAYLAEGVNKEATDKRAGLGRLKGLIEEDKGRLEQARRDVSTQAERFRAPDAAAARQRHQANLTRLTFLQTQLFQLDGQIRGQEQTLADLVAHPPAAEPDLAVRPADIKAATDLALAKDADVRSAQEAVDRLGAEAAEDRRVAVGGSKNPKVQDKEKALADARQRLSAREQAVREEVAQKLQKDASHSYDARLREHRTRITELKAQTDRLRGQMASMRAEADKLDADTLTEARGIAELDRLAGRATEVEDRIKAAKTKAEAMEVELRAPPRAQTLEPAVITQVPNPAKKRVMVAGAAFGGLLAGLFLIAALDLRGGRIDSPLGVGRHLQTGVVGCIPRVDPAAITTLARSSGPPGGSDAAMLCDATDACRALLLHALPTGSAPVIMVTSPQAGEGKTSLAAQLALSLGRAGYRTLLIDGDLRRASLHSLFGRSQSPGLADVLRRTHSVERVGRRTELSNLVVLPAGQCHPNEAVALLQVRLGSALRRCKSFFDVILVDTPPLSLPDAAVIGRHSDGTILSLMNEVSTLPAAQAACDRLRALTVPILGAVLNGTRARTPYGY
jgi:capsular exopolysaccharide synthesis family protein